MLLLRTLWHICGMENLQKLTECLRSRPEVLLAYLFGSAAQGRTHALSDVDIAVLVDEVQFRELDNRTPWGYQASLGAELAGALQRDDVDLVLLHSAPPLLKHQVVRCGRILLSRDEALRVDFEVRVHQEYLDTKPLREIQRAYLYEAIKEGRFGQAKVEP